MNVHALRYDHQGLLTVIAQDAQTGEVRMIAHANETAITRTLQTGIAWFFSRSRQRMWQKGESSGNTLKVHSIWADCDGDAVIYMVDPNGPSCHTGAETCFFQRLESNSPADTESSHTAAPTLLRLERTLYTRKISSAEVSYTKSLLEAGPSTIDAKVREEAAELGQALREETIERVASEAGDLVYHMLVGLVQRSVAWRDVLSELSRRFGRSGHDEKAAR